MLGITELLSGIAGPDRPLRYRQGPDRNPVVVWNVTRRCNLACLHCYSDSSSRTADGELTAAQCLRVTDDLAELGVPVILFSGGEPLLRPDLFDLAAAAHSNGIRAVLSTNGTLITPQVARRIQESRFSYVGISVDGMGAVHDRFRGKSGAYERTLNGIRYCRDLGIRVGLRLTLHQHNASELPAVMRLLETEGIPRCCIYHLAYSGRGSRLYGKDLSPAETRSAVQWIFDQAQSYLDRRIEKDILTVDNHADGVFLCLQLRQKDPDRAQQVYEKLKQNGGNQSGVAIGAIDWSGNVHADQFSTHYRFGNVLERPFSEIWQDESEPVLTGLRNRKPLLKGRCGKCRWLDLCNGNLRVRAERATGDRWASDPACYLTDEEIGLAKVYS